MLARLPELIDPLRYAEAGRILEGQISVAKMRRLASLLHSTAGEVKIVLTFGVDIQGTPYVQGSISAEVTLVCQRCLEPMVLPVHAQVSLGIVTTKAEAEILSGHYDPLLVGEEPVSLSELVEDELILALPTVARHESIQCRPAQGSQEELEPAEQRPNPFAVLERLKRN